MRQAVILGSPDTKRTIYFKQAAEQEGLPVVFVDWKNWQEGLRQISSEDIFLKIDPPLWTSSSLEELNQLADNYIGRLRELEMPDTVPNADMAFLNAPSAVAALLDKRVCKERLARAGLPVTKAVGESSLPDGEKQSTEWLFDIMRRERMHRVFIKPVKGSGAAGVSAFCWQPDKGCMVLYTCAMAQGAAGFVNTKRLRRFSDPKEVALLLNRILELGCIVERWYAKAQYQGFSYDIRAVVQDKTVDFLLGRLSQGPITNLHLNNRALDIALLKLPERTVEDIVSLCQKAMACYPQLRSAGIDILLEKGSLMPRIIEMNAQGDLIYQDIYHKNRIYRHQARIMKDWLTALG